MQYDQDVLAERDADAAEPPGRPFQHRVAHRHPVNAVNALRARALARGNVYLADSAIAQARERVSPEVTPRFELASLPQVLASGTPLRTSEDTARAGLRSLSLAQLVRVLADPMMHDGLPQLVPLLKVSDVIPCLRARSMAALVFRCLDPAQCKLLGPEVAALIGPYLPGAWSQLAHLPLETVVLIATDTFAELPVAMLRQLPPAHQCYLAPYVKRVRRVSRDDHDRVVCQALCQILHLYAHKIIDPEHIPETPQLRVVERDHALRAKAHELRWLVDAVMTDAVKAVQLGALRLPTVVVELRRTGATELADELERHFKAHKARRAWRYGGGLAYTQDRAIAVRHLRIEGASLAELTAALRDAIDGVIDSAIDSVIDGVPGGAIGGAPGGAIDRATGGAIDRVPGGATGGVPGGVPGSATDRAIGSVPGGMPDGMIDHATEERHAPRLPTTRAVTAIAIELDAALPGTAPAWAKLEAMIHARLDEPRARSAIHEVRLRGPSGTTRIYRCLANAGEPSR
jgi:hypothetical protein